MAIITARAIEFAQQQLANWNGLDWPCTHERWDHEIRHILTGKQQGFRGEYSLNNALEACYCHLAGDEVGLDKQRSGLVQHLVKNRDIVAVDDNKNIVFKNELGFNRAAASVNTQDDDTRFEAANRFFDHAMRDMMPMAQALWDCFDGHIPEPEQTRNLRITIDTEKNTVSFRRPTLLESMTDATLGRVRDADMHTLEPAIPQFGDTIVRGDTRTDLAHGTVCHRADRWANWIAHQSWLKPVVHAISDHYSSIVKPDNDLGHMVERKFHNDLDKWRNRRVTQSPEAHL